MTTSQAPQAGGYDGGVKPRRSVPSDLEDRTDVDHRDRQIIDEHADELNEEALDVLGFQVEMGETTWLLHDGDF